MYLPQIIKPDAALLQRERSTFHTVRSFGILPFLVTIACIAIDWSTIWSFLEKLFNAGSVSCIITSSAIALGIDVAPCCLGQILNLSQTISKPSGPEAKGHRLQCLFLLGAFSLAYLALLLFMFLSVSVGVTPDVSSSSGFSTGVQGAAKQSIPDSLSITSVYGPSVARSLLPLISSALCFAVSYNTYNRQARIQSLQSTLFELQSEIKSEECVIAKLTSDIDHFHPDAMDAEVACERVDLLRVLAEEALIAAKSELAAELGTVEAANSLLADTGLFTDDEYWSKVYDRLRNGFDYSPGGSCTVTPFPTPGSAASREARSS